MEQSATKGHKKDDNLLVMTKNKRSDGEKSRHRQQVKDKVKSDKTEIVPTNSNVNDGADDKMKDKVKDKTTANTASDDGAGDKGKDKVKSDKTEIVPTNSNVNDGANDKMKDKVKDEITATTASDDGAGDNVKDKVKDKIKDEVTTDTGSSHGVGDRDESSHRLTFEGRQLRRRVGLSDGERRIAENRSITLGIQESTCHN